MTPPPPAGRGIIIRGCRCALLGSPLGSQPLNKSNSVARDVSHAPSPLPIPSPRLEVSARRNRRNLLPPSVHQWHYPSRCCCIEISKRLIKRTLFTLCSCDKARGRRGTRNDDDPREGGVGRGGNRGGPRRRRTGKTWGWRRIQRAAGIGFLGVDSNDADVPCGEYLRR